MNFKSLAENLIRSAITETKEDASRVKDILNTKPTVPEDQRWLQTFHLEGYTNNKDEVHTKDLGVKIATHDNIPDSNLPHRGSKSYNKTNLRSIPLKDVHYTQTSVNKGKLEHFAEHYHPKIEDFHPEDGVLSKWEAPHATKYPDGKYVSSDHHRLIASHLRGDTHAFARVSTLDYDGGGGLTQVKTPKYRGKPD